MIKKYAELIVKWLINYEAVEETDKELYEYAIYSMILSASPLILAIIYGALISSVGQGIAMIFPFVVMRKFSGGYHTKHVWSCFVWSNILIFFCLYLSSRIEFKWELILITAGAVINLIIFSPIDNENRILCFEEHKHCKKMVVMIGTILLTVDILFVSWKLYEYSIGISMGIILSACLQFPCIIKKLKMYVK